MELAVAARPADLALRRDAMRFYMHANGIVRRTPGRPSARVIDATNTPAPAERDREIDRSGARQFRALGHLRATAESHGPATRGDLFDALRAVAQPPTDPALPTPGMIPADAFERLRRHVDTWRAFWLDLADENLRRGRTDDAMCLDLSTSQLPAAERADRAIAFVAARRDVVGLPGRVAEYSALLGGPVPATSPSDSGSTTPSPG